MDLPADAPPWYLIHDRDATFLPAFAAIFAVEGVEVVCMFYRTPMAHTHAERRIRSVRQARRWLGQQTPAPDPPCLRACLVRWKDVLGGLHHRYGRETA